MKPHAKRIASAIGLIALLVTAAPAAAKPHSLHYEGETDDGNSISFSVTGKQVSDINGYVTSVCVPTSGVPVTYLGEFNPPGSFALGKTRKASKSEYMSYRGDVTKNYTVTIKPFKGRVWIAELHVNYSYEELRVAGAGEVDQDFYICQGDDSFKFAV